MKKKINWLLILQGWAMMWVVIGHSPMTLDAMTWYERITYNFDYSFHMPLFVYISGYLFYLTRVSPVKDDGSRKWSWAGMMKDKLVRLGIPFIVFTVIAMVMKGLFPDIERATSYAIWFFAGLATCKWMLEIRGGSSLYSLRECLCTPYQLCVI